MKKKTLFYQKSFEFNSTTQKAMQTAIDIKCGLGHSRVASGALDWTRAPLPVASTILGASYSMYRDS